MTVGRLGCAGFLRVVVFFDTLETVRLAAPALLDFSAALFALVFGMALRAR